ncbi:hypothetical protein ACWDYH_37775 [Nocardia goodfellowii]
MGQFYRAVLLDGDSDTVSSYLDPRDFDNDPRLLEHSWIGFRFVEACEGLLRIPARVVWAGAHARLDPRTHPARNLYSHADSAAHGTVGPPVQVGRYLINHDRRVYVDKDRCRFSGHGWALHPLPLLTAESYGRGIGERHLFGRGSDVVGSWARDRISVEDTLPEDYRQIPFDLTASRYFILDP